VIPALSTVFTVVSAAAVGWGLGTGNPVVLAPGLVGLVCALPLQSLSYQVFIEGRAVPELKPLLIPEEVLWNNPYINDWKETR
jgi:hypothetical protein